MKYRAAVIVDKANYSNWQREALDFASDVVDVVLILDCQNTRTKKRYFKNFLYYVLNIISIRSKQTQAVEFEVGNTRVVTFKSRYEKGWQCMPDNISDEIKIANIDMVIKFGMSLLRVDEELSNIPIFSYHHGDPRSYRGRPAGFYELMNDEDKLGVIVQTINNRLDAGTVYSIGYSKIFHHSYKQTTRNFYAISKYLLRSAIVNWAENRVVGIESFGRNYRLPPNFVVVKFATKLFVKKLRRLIYGLFFEKKWEVATLEWSGLKRGNNLLKSEGLKRLNIPKEYTFFADPFFATTRNLVRVEALDRRTGLGDIINVNLETGVWERILTGEHYSYPFSFKGESNVEYLLPEVASHSAPYFLIFSQTEISKLSLKGLKNKRIVDPTVLKYGAHIYLFFSEADTASNALHLFYSSSLNGEFSMHPSSPIIVDPSGARMGGRVLDTPLGLLRFGQDNCRGYGARLNIFRIKSLSPSFYEEERIGSLMMRDYQGPHTLDVSEDGEIAVVDFYNDRFSLLAGYRRLSALLRRSKAGQ